MVKTGKLRKAWTPAIDRSSASVSSNHFQKQNFVFFLQDFINLKVKQLLIGQTVWFNQSEVVLLSELSLGRSKTSYLYKFTDIGP